MAASNPIVQCSLINYMQKIVIYETKSQFYVVGSNNTESRFRVLKLDRSEQRKLNVVDDQVEYSPKEIQDLLHMIDVGNRSKLLQRGSSGLSRTISAFGIVGFVRFLEGYYIILIIKRRRVALIGPHTIYKIEDTRMEYIPNDTVRYMHPDEQRYVKMFKSMDLSSNFYFSYSYDLTRTLQYNMAECRNLQPLEPQVSGVSEERQNKDVVYGIRTEPSSKFVWNWYLLKDVHCNMHRDWLLYVLHGFIGQSNIVIFGRPIYLTLIARRSRKYAGTRFLKRGSNTEGDVANEVETEQIVLDASVLSLRRAAVTAFVQLRASIPAHWSQDVAKMVPKPTINVDQLDPYGYVAGLHFDQVLQRYGAPVIILDLVKRKEKKKRESVASEQMVAAIDYLNQFLPPQHVIKYIGFDMARVTKKKKASVFSKLANIAEYCIKKTGYFQTGPRFHGNCTRSAHLNRFGAVAQKQRGVVRTNCVDCLDRTNTAQFAIGKCVLAHQLYGLGVLDSPSLQFDTDCVRMLEDLYEDHGDTLALQYGGSQLVHRIKGYRKVAPWTSSSRDIVQTMSRCYSNAFSDADRQQAMNLFLGVFTPREGQANIWELSTDFYLHNTVTLHCPKPRLKSYSQWWDRRMKACLPNALDEERKGTEAGIVAVKTDRTDERVDAHREYYHPSRLTVVEELYSFHMHNSIRDFMPKCVNSYSPFVLRVRPGRRQEESGTTEANPNVSGRESTSSCTSGGSDTTSGSETDVELDDGGGGGGDGGGGGEAAGKADCQARSITLKDRFPTMMQTYGVDIHPPNKQTVSLYKWFVQIGQNASHLEGGHRSTHLIQRSIFPLDCSRHVEPPTVSPTSRDVYATYVKRGERGAAQASKRSMKTYHDYVLGYH